MAIRVREAHENDLKPYLELQKKRWQENNVVSLANLQARLEAHPEGMLVAEENGEIVGMVYAMRISSYDESNPPSWYQITNNGACDNHDPNGPIMFGVDLTTAPGVGARAGDALLEAIGQMVVRNNLQIAMLGGRMPGYHIYKDQLTAEEYLWAKNDRGEFLDRQVRFYASIPGLRVIKALPKYFDDPESDDYGVLLKWNNPFYSLPLPRLWGMLFPYLLKLENKYVDLVRKIKHSSRA